MNLPPAVWKISVNPQRKFSYFSPSERDYSTIYHKELVFVIGRNFVFLYVKNNFFKLS